MTSLTINTSRRPSSNSLFIDTNDVLRALEIRMPQLLHQIIYEEHRAQLEDNKEQYRSLCQETDFLRKKLIMMKQEIHTYRQAQERSESRIYAQDQELSTANKEIQKLTRRNKEIEKRLERELQNYESDRLLWQQQESDLRSEIKQWVQQHTNPRRTRSATASNVTWTGTSTSAPSSSGWDDRCTQRFDSLAARDAKIRIQEQLLSDLKAELQQQKVVGHETAMTMEAQASQIEALTQELHDIKIVNASLMEDNEGYQLLLHEKTMAGELFKRSDDSTSLAAELEKVTPDSTEGEDDVAHSSGHVQKLSEEIKNLQESNKALTLYMNKILLKILENNQLVDVLNIDESSEKPVTSQTVNPTLRTTVSRPRRSTISTWMTPRSFSASSSSGDHARSNSGQATNSGGWTRALKRMTVIGWPSKSQRSDSLSSHGTNSHDSAISSCAEDEDEEEKNSHSQNLELCG
ncbi:uncharacterized protein BYT42DRAFT_563124 [Radiomyces spectabilis]|uniref:uncharacterized protein n=1 Tax=Radiomyces spectabilis TaxID=64574 RepID=UPI002220144B|nr:uncharacterized protein BYT42DRAFT_563124 [Radiomyces spectabilis]KAI8384625.1 hypothetical protein BYT42DRAFT_563124 [Radiomyces spectabilis]